MVHVAGSLEAAPSAPANPVFSVAPDTHESGALFAVPPLHQYPEGQGLPAAAALPAAQ